MMSILGGGGSRTKVVRPAVQEHDLRCRMGPRTAVGAVGISRAWQATRRGSFGPN